ncbi:MAG TPA: sulfotransferase [Thermoguttaceae bacterium]|nr:sulfotransferase [Thermoguttaceae bacterium]
MEGNDSPIVIIGAGRSGTNMLRNVLTALRGLGTWPCDEINYLWRHRNARHPTDEFTPEMARPRVKASIRRAFDRLARRRGLASVVEKTCANSLRVGFVNAVFPRARFVHVIRDGRDVAVSAAERWTAPLDVAYLLKKARFVPPADLPYYGTRYLWNRLYRIVGRRKRLAVWGPRFAGMEETFRVHPLQVACALQWKRCVERACADFAEIDPARVHEIRYERFVAEPAGHLRRLARFMGVEASPGEISRAVDGVSSRSVGRWEHRLPEEIVQQIHLSCGDTLRRFEYVRRVAA